MGLRFSFSAHPEPEMWLAQTPESLGSCLLCSPKPTPEDETFFEVSVLGLGCRALNV